MAFVASCDAPDLSRVLLRSGVPVLAEGRSEGERHVHLLLGLQPATSALVSEMLLRLHSLVPDERAAANQEPDRYWAYLRVLMHLLDTRVIAPRDPRLGQVWLRCNGTRAGVATPRFKRVNQVTLPSVFGELLPQDAFQDASFYLADMPPSGANEWDGVTTIAYEVFLARLGCSSPLLVAPDALQRLKDEAQKEGSEEPSRLVTIDMSKLYGQDVGDMLEFTVHHEELLRSGLITVRSQCGNQQLSLRPTDCFMPYVVEDDELPVVLLDPTVPPEACRAGQPLYNVMVGLGIRQRPNVKYFLRAIVRVALASTEGDLGAMPAFHRLRSAQAIEGEKTQLGETELTVLKIRLVQRLLHALCREDPLHVRQVAQELFAQSELLLPCATEQGCKVVPVAKLFLLNSYDEMVMGEEQRQGYVAGVGLLDGVRATTLHNVGYLAYSQLLTALGAPAAFSHVHVMHALGCVQALHARLKERITPVQPLEEEEEEEEHQRFGEQPGSEEGKETFESLHAKALNLYRCLNDMLGGMEPGPRYKVAAGIRLLTDQGAFAFAGHCLVPDGNVFVNRRTSTHSHGTRETIEGEAQTISVAETSGGMGGETSHTRDRKSVLWTHAILLGRRRSKRSR